MLNVRDASYEQLIGNTEIAHVSEALGLDFNHTHSMEEEKGRQLRYGKVEMRIAYTTTVLISIPLWGISYASFMVLSVECVFFASFRFVRNQFIGCARLQWLSCCWIVLTEYVQTTNHEKQFSAQQFPQVLLMMDQDHDGSHIKGLFINFIHKFWPKLLEENNFLEEFVTPIVKARKGKYVLIH